MYQQPSNGAYQPPATAPPQYSYVPPQQHTYAPPARYPHPAPQTFHAPSNAAPGPYHTAQYPPAAPAAAAPQSASLPISHAHPMRSTRPQPVHEQPVVARDGVVGLALGLLTLAVVLAAAAAFTAQSATVAHTSNAAVPGATQHNAHAG